MQNVVGTSLVIKFVGKLKPFKNNIIKRDNSNDTANYLVFQQSHQHYLERWNKNDAA